MSVSISKILRTEIVYPDSDGKPMADNTLQFRWIVTIKEGLEWVSQDQPKVFGRIWDRSPNWSQIRSTGRQRGWWRDRVRRDRRVRPRRSARCEKRGVKSDQELGVANLGTDGPARHSRWFSPA